MGEPLCIISKLHPHQLEPPWPSYLCLYVIHWRFRLYQLVNDFCKVSQCLLPSANNLLFLLGLSEGLDGRSHPTCKLQFCPSLSVYRVRGFLSSYTCYHYLWSCRPSRAKACQCHGNLVCRFLRLAWPRITRDTRLRLLMCSGSHNFCPVFD